MKISILAICILCTHGAAAATADNYAYAWPLQTNGDSAAWQVDLTPEVYATIRDANLRDIEVVNAAGESVPMAPRAAQMGTAALRDVELPLFVLPVPAGSGAHEDSLHLLIERDADGRLRRLDTNSGAANTAPPQGDLILDASALAQPIDSLWLYWNDDGSATTAQFSVSGSDDLQQWRVLNGSANVLAMQQNGNSLSRRQIALNGARAKYLRLHRLDTGVAMPGLRVRARLLGAANLIQPARVWVDARVLPTPADDRRSPPGFDYELPAPLAVEALRLELVGDNSLARVRVRSRVHAGDDANAWQTRAEFTAFRLRQDDSVIDNDESAVATNGRAQQWRVDPATPLSAAPTLRVAFRPDRFVFLAQGNGPYRLVAGSARAQRGDYPVDAALAQLRSKLGNDWQPPLAALGAKAELQGTAAYTMAPVEVHRDWKTWSLWAVLVGAAVLIGGMALSLLRKK
jgi:hypothetical protein